MTNGCEFEFMEYADEESIDPNLMCVICHKALKDPVCTPCDHTYGRECITHWLSGSQTQSCPLCADTSLTMEKLHPVSRVLRNMLDQLRVHCKLCTRKDLKRGNFIDHINKECSKAVIPCQAADIKCPWQGTRDEAENHLQNCYYEPLRPALSYLIVQNRQLLDQVQSQAKEINQLTETVSRLQKISIGDSENDSDTASNSEASIDESTVIQDDTIFIRNLPVTVKFNDIFDVFSKVGPIKYNNQTNKVDIFIFNHPNRKDGRYSAKVAFLNKEAAAAALKQFNGQHIPQWNTRLHISLGQRKRKDLNKQERCQSYESMCTSKQEKQKQNVKMMENPEKTFEKDQVASICSADMLNTNPQENQRASTTRNRHRRRNADKLPS